MGYSAKQAAEAGAAYFVEEMAGKGISLDFSEETIRQLDALIADFWPRARTRTRLALSSQRWPPTWARSLFGTSVPNGLMTRSITSPQSKNRGDRVCPISELADRLRRDTGEPLSAFYETTQKAWQSRRKVRRSPWRIFRR